MVNVLDDETIQPVDRHVVPRAVLWLAVWYLGGMQRSTVNEDKSSISNGKADLMRQKDERHPCLHREFTQAADVGIEDVSASAVRTDGDAGALFRHDEVWSSLIGRGTT